MDLDEVTKLVEEFRLSKPQGAEESLNLDDEDVKIGEQRIENCLVAKVLSPKMINHEAFKVQMPRILQAICPIEVGSIGDNFFLMDFKSIHDKSRSLKWGPWNFFRDLVIFTEPYGMQNPKTLRFDEISLWIQCHNLPLLFMNKEILEKVGKQIGLVEEVDTRANGLSMGNYARIWVRIDITKPLKKFIRITAPQQEEGIIALLTYERLPDFSYNCGCIGHSFRECENLIPMNGKLEFGSWLKAVNPNGGEKFKNTSQSKSYGRRDNSPSNSSTRNNKTDTDIHELVAVERESRMLTALTHKEVDLNEDSHQENAQPNTSQGFNKHKQLIPSGQKKWKRRARGKGLIATLLPDLHEVESRHIVTGNPQNSHNTFQKRSIGNILDPITMIQRRWLRSNTADQYELHILECLRAWEPTIIPQTKVTCHRKDHTLLFLCETKVKGSNIKWWKNMLGFSGLFAVDCNGRSGGLLLLWKDPFNLTIHLYSLGHIDGTIKHGDKFWRFTGFYGHPDTRSRHLSWSLLRRLSELTELQGIAWIVGGDFNEICYDSEKYGGNQRPLHQTRAFRDTLDTCSLQDLHGSGELFTWVKRRASDHIIFERLDRYVATFEWRLLYPVARAQTLEFFHSDHRPILLELGALQSQPTRNNNMFRFEPHWVAEADCEDIVTQGWQKEYKSLSLPNRIQSVKICLRNWAANRFRDLPKKIQNKRRQLNQLRTMSNGNIRLQKSVS